MRVFLIVLVLLALFATGWHAAFQGSEKAHLRGAPQIERDIHRGAILIVADAGGEPVEVRTSGRYVTLTGPVESQDKRTRLIREISALPLVGGVRDDMTVLDRAVPFTLEILKAPDGAITVKGYVPNRRAEDRLLAQARDLGDGARVTAEIKIAAGAPDGNWIGMVSSGLRALAAMNFGSLQVADDQARLAGEVADATAHDTVLQIISDAPMGQWTSSITAAPPKNGYTFTVDMPAEGNVTIGGYAPDKELRDNLRDATRRRTGRPVNGRLTVAGGMPGPAWPEQAYAGLAALSRLDNGSLIVRDWTVAITGTVDTDADMAALTPLLNEKWQVSITVRNPTPPGNITLLMTTEGNIAVSGLLPEGMTAEQIQQAFPDADVSGLDPQARGKKADWTSALDALSIVMPRFVDLEVVIAGRNLGVKGLLKSDFNAEGVHATLRTALRLDWSLSVSAMERRPPSEITFSMTRGNALISGVLPVGLRVEEVLAMAGETSEGIGLAGGGEGDLAAWRSSLKAITSLFPVFSELTGKISEHRIALSGRLQPGYSAETVRRQLVDTAAEAWDVDLSAAETPANEGDRRRDLEMGETQTFRNGFWLPDVDFPVSVQTCAARIDQAMDGQRFSFADGGTSLTDDNAGLLNRIAAIAIRCLNSSEMRMEISAHTSSVGNDQENKVLTERQAGAVAGALVRRGVRPGAIIAVGRGEEDPVTTNNTAEGRAQNRRIAFGWLETAE